MKTLMLPLDERPCNYLFPGMIAQSNKEIQLFLPEKNILGDKKNPANTEAIEKFLFDNIAGCDNIILSVDMLIYGGLIPSRLHYLSKEDALHRLEIIKKLKSIKSDVKIYAFNCIMRTPQYNSSDEEPDYYANYGYALYRREYLLDYQSRHEELPSGGLNKEELNELKKFRIPQEFINDYEQRRIFNESINIEVLDYLESGLIDFLVIPQDDSSPYGYTAISQKNIMRHIRNKNLDMKVMIYPGADEVSLSLLARVWNDYKGFEVKIFPFYASVLGPSIVPLYEDRPMFESLKSHVRVCKGKLVTSPQEADFILAVNCPGKIPQDTYDEEIDISYTSCRNLPDFVLQIKDYIDAGKKVAVCDSAFCNGGDIQFIHFLDDLDVLDKLLSYAGWNTNCNTLGTTLAQACIAYSETKDLTAGLQNLLYRIIDDFCYQAIVRHELIRADFPNMKLDENDITPALAEVENIIKNELQAYYNKLKIAENHPVKIRKVYSPWKRMFEIGMEIE